MLLNLKNVLTGLFIIATVHVFGQTQNINQFDAQGKRHGLWKKHYEDSQQLRYQGTFKHGQEVGIFKFYKPDSEDQPAATKTYTSKSDTVILKFYNNDGILITQGKLLHKKRVGEWNYFHTNTQLMMQEHYANGQLDGWKVVYYENGQVTSKKKYKNGRLNGLKLMYSKNGQLLAKYHYNRDTLEGYSKVFTVEGDLISEGNYKNGQRDGKWKFFTEGKLDSVQTYPLKKISKNILPDEVNTDTE